MMNFTGSVTVKKIKVVGVSTLATQLITQRADVCARTGVQIEFIAPCWPFPPKVAKHRDGRPKGCNGGSPLTIVKEAWAIRKVLAEVSPSLLHIHFGAGPYAAWAVIFAKCPYMISLMGAEVLPEEQPHPTFASKWITQTLLRYAGLLTAKSDFLATRALTKNYCRTKPVVLRWGVDAELFHASTEETNLRVRYGIEPSDFVVFSPRSMEPLYNSRTIVEAFGRVVEHKFQSPEKPKIWLFLQVLGKDPDYIGSLVHWVRDQKWSAQVIFLESLKHELMPQYYFASDTVVMVPSSDGLPQSLMEALACGKPTIVSRLKCYEELVEEKVNCIMVEPRSVTSLAQAIINLIQDSQARVKIGAQALKVGETLSQPNQTNLLASLYVALAGKQCALAPWFIKPTLLVFLTTHYLEEGIRKIYKRLFGK